jgi:uncharacterized protein (DUF58 family)
MANATPSIDPRVHTSLNHLLKLERRARNLSFLPGQPSGSVLNGRHGSRMRGRGLNFEELRGYLPGDDVRTIDWKVTARTGEPHIRVYTEERDRPALLLVDQRMSMFFGSRLNMKSVTAAETAAIAAWRILSVGDRVGGIVFDDRDVSEQRPQRSRRGVITLLNKISAKNLALNANLAVSSDPVMLNTPLEAIARIARHDHLVIIISDFDGVDADTHKIVARLATHNDVVLVLVHDPVARVVPENMRLTVSDGQLQVTLDTHRHQTRMALHDVTATRLQRILDWQTQLGVPVLPLSAGEPTLPQIQSLLGGLAARRR